MDNKGGLKRPWSGKQLETLLNSLSKAIEIVLEKQAENSGPKEIKAGGKKCAAKELKAILCVGINHVTRALERMPLKPPEISEGEQQPKRAKTADNVDGGLETSRHEVHPQRRSITNLQAVIVAVDVHPRTLVSHLGVLCGSRGVPMLSVSGGDGCGSLKLGELLGTRTAIAIGIKAGDTAINWALESILETRKN